MRGARHSDAHLHGTGGGVYHIYAPGEHLRGDPASGDVIDQRAFGGVDGVARDRDSTCVIRHIIDASGVIEIEGYYPVGGLADVGDTPFDGDGGA